jgi:hypothetical protein
VHSRTVVVVARIDANHSFARVDVEKETGASHKTHHEYLQLAVAALRFHLLL